MRITWFLSSSCFIVALLPPNENLHALEFTFRCLGEVDSTRSANSLKFEISELEKKWHVPTSWGVTIFNDATLVYKKPWIGSNKLNCVISGLRWELEDSAWRLGAEKTEQKQSNYIDFFLQDHSYGSSRPESSCAPSRHHEFPHS